MQHQTLSRSALAAMVLAALATGLAPAVADARPGARGGGVRAGGGGFAAGRATAGPRAGGGMNNVRASGPTSIARGGNRTNVANNSGNRINTGNVNVGNNVNVNVEGHGGCCYGGWSDHPVATAAAVGAVVGTTAAITSAALGARYYALPPACSPYMTSYYYCGGVYYQPQYQGDKVVYVVVSQPR